MTQSRLTHCYHIIHVCHNDIYTLTHCYHLIPVCHNKTKYIDTKGNMFSG